MVILTNDILPKHYTIPVFIPELACPFQCVFCDQRKITGKALLPADHEILATVRTHLASFRAAEPEVEIGFFGGSFTGLPPERQKHYLKLVRPFLEQGQVSGIRLSTRPDYIDKEILKLLRDAGVRVIELGAQSMDEQVLKSSRRGHTAKQTEQASAAILAHGFELGLQMMIGLPGDTLQKSMETARKIIQLGASNTRIYPTVVIRETTLHAWFLKGEYRPLSLEEAVEWTTCILPLFEKAGVQVIRAGLHPSEGLLSGEELVAGPFHPSFRELVLTRIWEEQLKPLARLPQAGHLEIRVPEREINYAVGYRSKNRRMLEAHFRRVRFHADSSLHQREFKYSTG